LPARLDYNDRVGVVRQVVAILLAWGSTTPVRAGVCVEIDATRDNLDEQERSAVRIAVIDALAREGVVADGPPCTALITAYNIRLGKQIATTITSGANQVSGKASSIDELDLLVRQLVRSLVTGRMFATGTGVQDRENVLRDQTAPLREDPSSRRWDAVVGVGGGMLQLPALENRALQRQTNIVALDGRLWGFAHGGNAAFELRARLLIHDYAVFGAAHDRYTAARDSDTNESELAWSAALMASPLGLANWEVGIGFAKMLGMTPPHPYARIGFSASALSRFSDPDHRFDLGLGAYAGLGFQLSEQLGVSVEANVARPFFHGLVESGYAYFLTTTAMLEFRSRSSARPFQSEPVPTIRRINE
jgi:hypothetical protein